MTLSRWLPHLGDRVAVESPAGRSTGVVSRWDPAVVVVDRSSRDATPVTGQRVHASWLVDGERFQGDASVEDVAEGSYTVRLDGPVPVPDFARRRDVRQAVALPLKVSHPYSGSLDAGPRPARALDLSAGGMRVRLEPGCVQIGDVLDVHAELEGRTERLVAYVVWERPHGSGDRVAGLRFRDEIRLDAWA